MADSPLYTIFKSNPMVSTDSREIVDGSIFFALSGANFDGNRFAVQALERGASYAVCDNRQAVRQLAGACDYVARGRIIFVENVLTALQELAAEHRRSWRSPVLAITGTNGKTTTKELICAVLATRYKVHATRGNLNNHIGVPLTILSAPVDTQVAVIEMGASACGEIAQLCEIAAPGLGLITNIGRAHLEGFGGVEGIVRGKGELYDYLERTGGTAFYLSSDPTLNQMIAGRPKLKAIPYSVSLAQGAKSNLAGDYNRSNIAAAVAIGVNMGVPDNAIARAIASYTPNNNRSQRIDTGRNIVIADSYNANPSSMAAAIDSFARMEGAKVVILGDMLELGSFCGEEHENVILKLAACKIGEAWLVGSCFAKAYMDLSSIEGVSTRLFRDTQTLCKYLRDNPPAGKVILLKGSRGIGLERVVPLL